MRGKYMSHINAWLEIFPRRQFFFGLFEDLVAAPEEFTGRVFDFLGVPTIVPLSIPESRKNESTAKVHPMDPALRTRLLAAFENETSELERFLGRDLEAWRR